MRTAVAIALAFALIFVAVSAQAERRVALVIGNDRYTQLPDLNNAGRDARDMAAKLKTLGFEVIARYNASRRDMGRAIRTFSARLSAGGTGLAFFAGHGVQANGTNYLIPADANIEIEDDLEFLALDANRILQAMKAARNPLNILILDACRDNPLPARVRSATRGLAITALPSGVKGTAILYAAGPGQTARDGPKGGNGVFAGALMKYMDQPGWTLEQVFKATSREVLRRTNNRQRPWQLVSLQGDFYFKKSPPRAPLKAAAPAPRPTQSAPRGTSDATAIAIWREIKDSNDAEVFQVYIDNFPTSPMAPFARLRLARLNNETSKAPPPPAAQPLTPERVAPKPAERRQRLAAARSKWEEEGFWRAVKDSNDIAELQVYLRQYPEGRYAPEARSKIEILERSRLATIVPKVPKPEAQFSSELNGKWEDMTLCEINGETKSVQLRLNIISGKYAGQLHAKSMVEGHSNSGDLFVLLNGTHAVDGKILPMSVSAEGNEHEFEAGPIEGSTIPAKFASCIFRLAYVGSVTEADLAFTSSNRQDYTRKSRPTKIRNRVGSTADRKAASVDLSRNRNGDLLTTLSPNDVLVGTLTFNKTEKHPDFNDPSPRYPDMTCEVRFEMRGFEISEWFKCDDVDLKLIARFQPNGTFTKLEINGRGSAYILKGTLPEASAIDTGRQYWRATLKLGK